jgi:excisionase family DNA binding protein
MSGRLVDAAAIADRLGVPKSWVLESARSGAILCVRLGRCVRFDEGDVDAWIAACKSPHRLIAEARASARRLLLRLRGGRTGAHVLGRRPRQES